MNARNLQIVTIGQRLLVQLVGTRRPSAQTSDVHPLVDPAGNVDGVPQPIDDRAASSSRGQRHRDDPGVHHAEQRCGGIRQRLTRIPAGHHHCVEPHRRRPEPLTASMDEFATESSAGGDDPASIGHPARRFEAGSHRHGVGPGALFRHSGHSVSTVARRRYQRADPQLLEAGVPAGLVLFTAQSGPDQRRSGTLHPPEAPLRLHFVKSQVIHQPNLT